MNPHSDAAAYPARILIVDDERHNRQLMELILTAEGFQVLTAVTGEDALTMLAEQMPDLILLDIMMPGMDGYAVVRKVKGDSSTKHIPVIMVTALSDRDARLSGLSAGAEDFLTKPVDRAELCVRVRNLLRLKAYGDYYDRHSQMLEAEVALRTADLVKRAETLQQQSKVLAEQAALLDLAQDAIVVRDMDNRILFWSRGAEIMFGWLSAEVLGKDIAALLKTEFSVPADRIEAILLLAGVWEGEAVHHKRDGARVIVASRWALQRDPGGAPVRVLTLTSDISDRKRADSELLLLTKRDQIRIEQIRFKDEFLSHVSHELRTPLTAIKQFTTILLGGLAGDLNTEQRDYQQIVLKNIEHLQSMIGDLLEVTRLEAGKLSVEPERVAIEDAVNDAVDTLSVTARAKGVAVSCDVPPDLPSAYADRTRLRQILIILLDNAIKFSVQGGAASIHVRVRPDHPRFLLFEVTDAGCGVSPDIIERIFERLYQVSGAAKASREGLGLGLYICKELVTRQGGHIWVTSQPHKGSTFSFTVPVFFSRRYRDRDVHEPSIPEVVYHE